MEDKLRAKLWIGTSGYYYLHWENGVFYPTGLSKSKQLSYYSKFFDTVELNVTFYRLPQEKAFSTWKTCTPDGFIFAIKGSRFITHIKRLKDSTEPISTFFKRASLIEEKLGVVLWQLPPKFSCDLKRLEEFLKALVPWEGFKHAFEFRHRSWFCKEVYELIRSFNMSVCQADWPGLKVEVPNNFPFIYIRRHGPKGERLYSGCYNREEIEKDAKYIISQLNAGKEVFIYFNNDAFGYAIKNALELKSMIHDTVKSYSR